MERGPRRLAAVVTIALVCLAAGAVVLTSGAVGTDGAPAPVPNVGESPADRSFQDGSTPDAGTTTAQPGDETGGPTVTRSGLTVQDTGTESGFRRTAANLLGRSVETLPPETTVLFANGTVTVVLSTDRIPAGRATVTGTLLYDAATTNATSSPELSVLNASSVTVDTNATPTSVHAMLETDAVGHVELTDDLRLAGVASPPPESPPWSVQTGYIGGEQLSHRLLAFPGFVARATVLSNSLSEARRRVGTDLNGGLRTRGTGHPFWADAPATVTGVRVDPDRSVFGPAEPPLFVTRIDVVDGIGVTARELAVAPGRYEGEVVTVESRSTGIVWSTAGLLDEAEFCPGEYERRQGNICYELPIDLAVHGGVLVAGTDSTGAGTATLPYAGLSTAPLSESRRLERGRYRITGRVVPAATVDPRLDAAYAVLVYERERIGGRVTEEGRTGRNGTTVSMEGTETVEPTVSMAARARGRRVAELLAWQVRASFDERAALYEAADDGRDDRGVQLTAVDLSAETVSAGSPITLTATLTNGAASARSLTLELHEGGVVYDTVSVRLSGGANETVRFEFAVFETGTHRLSINDWSTGSVVVTAGDDPGRTGERDDSSGLLGGLDGAFPPGDGLAVAVVLLVAVAVAGLARRRPGP